MQPKTSRRFKKRLAAVTAAGVDRALSGPVVPTGAGAAPAGKAVDERRASKPDGLLYVDGMSVRDGRPGAAGEPVTQRMHSGWLQTAFALLPVLIGIPSLARCAATSAERPGRRGR